jgi:tetratricopeptide (TPR) repeat protein
MLPNCASFSEQCRRDLLCGAGVLARLQSNYTAAISWYEEAHAVPSEQIDQTVRILDRLGEIYRVQGNTPRAQQLLEECLSHYQRTGNRAEEARTLNALGWAQCDEGDIAGGIMLSKQSLQLWRTLGDEQHRAWTAGVCNTLGYMETLRGNFRAARRYLMHSLTVRQELSYAPDIAWTKSNLVPVAIAEEQWTEARSYLVDSIRVLHDLGQILGVAWTLSRFARLEQALNHPMRTATLIAAAEQTYRQYGLHLPPTERPGHGQTHAYAQQELTKDEFEDAWFRGTQMTLRQAVAFALEEGDT